MEHIDEKLTRLQQYHLIINDIAEALGYRTGQTYEPVELVRMVKELKEREQKLITTVSFFSSVIKTGEPWSDTCQWFVDQTFAQEVTRGN